MTEPRDSDHQQRAAHRMYLGSEALRTLAALVIVVAGLKLSADFVVPLLLAGFFTLALNPVAKWLREKGVPQWLAITVAFLLAFGLLAGIGMLIANSIEDLRAALPRYEERISEITGSAVAWLGAHGVPLTEEGLSGLGAKPEALLDFVAGLVESFGGALSNAIVVLLVMVFMMFEAESLPAKLRGRGATFRSSLDRGARVARGVTDYLSVKTVISLLTGLTWGVFLAILGVDFPALWGLVAFLLNYIPNVGSVIAAIPPILLALVQFGLGKALLATGGCIVVNGVFGNVLEPKLMGQRVGLSVLVVFVGLIFWSWIFGAVGTVLSVPLTMAVKMGLEATDDYASLAALMGPSAKTETPPAPPG